MPTYDYRCVNPDCLNEIERFLPRDGTTDQECPLCGSRMKKLVGAPSHRFAQKRGTMGVSTNRGDRGIDKQDISF